MGDVELGDEVEEVDLLYFAVVGEVVEQFAHIGRAGNHLLHHSAEGLEDGGVVDRGKKELYLFDVYVVFPDLLLQLDLVLAPCVLLGEFDVCLVDEDEHAAAVGVLVLEILVDVVEGVSCLVEVGRSTEHVDECRGVLEDHLFIGRRLVDVVLGWKVVQLELLSLIHI